MKERGSVTQVIRSPVDRHRRRRPTRVRPRPPGLGWVGLAVLLVTGVAMWWGRFAAPPPQPSDARVLSPPPAGAVEERIVRVIDGDTVEGERLGRIRYIGINTPEKDAPDPEVRAMAREATEVNRSLVQGRTVRLAFDVQTRDRYGRVLAYVWAEDTFVNAYLVAEGYAQAMTVPPNVRYASLFVELERQARAGERGFWGRRPDWVRSAR